MSLGIPNIQLSFALQHTPYSLKLSKHFALSTLTMMFFAKIFTIISAVLVIAVNGSPIAANGTPANGTPANGTPANGTPANTNGTPAKGNASPNVADSKVQTVCHSRRPLDDGT